MDGNNLLTWMDGLEMKPIAMLAWGGEYDNRGTVLTRDVERIRDVCAKVVTPWGAYQKATFPEGMEGLKFWTADDVVQVSNGDDGHTFQCLSRNPPNEPQREWQEAPKPKRDVPIEADIAAVRDALREAEADTDPDDINGMTHVRALRDTLDGLLAEQRRGA